MTPETRNLLMAASEEIMTLRRENEILQAKVEVMDLFACTLHTAPALHSQGMGEDVVWKIKHALATEDLATEDLAAKKDDHDA